MIFPGILANGSIAPSTTAAAIRTSLGLGTADSPTFAAVNGVLLTTGGSASQFLNGAGAYATPDHGSFGGLSDDDHSQYALLAGRAGGQSLIGGTASGNSLTLRSSSHGTKGKIVFGNAATTVYDEVNDRIGIGTDTPTARLHVIDTATGAHNVVISGPTPTTIYHGQLNFTATSTGSSGLARFAFGNSESAWGSIDFTSDGTMDSGKIVLRTRTVADTFINALTVNSLGNVLIAGFTSATKGLIVKGNTSQTAVLAQLQGISSTSTSREQADIDTAWIDSTDATRKARLVLRAWDTSAREVARGWGDGSVGRIALAAPASAPTDAHLAASQISFYLDEVGHNLLVRAKYADGTTLKLATIALA